ncbi:MAG: non-canonical purine NTP pyrophosphatase, partial [Thermoplasmata archaeon]|nr:non-canonical purine NTP pyrophosphatase [Thermoplasmata archaeon]
FGYDPIFVPEGQDLTFAQLSMDEKNQESHRSRAFDALVGKLRLGD